MAKNRLKIDISSTAIEKGIDLAKEFLEKLILPPIEETGLLMKEKVTYWRFQNQVKMINKAREYCLKNNIQTKSISLKLLCPLIENASLEDDEFLQDKWAILLSNLVDSEQNIENHVFPFLLGQISKSEFIILEKCFFLKEEKLKKLNLELKNFRILKLEKEVNLKEKIDLNENLENNGEKNKNKRNLEKELRDLEREENRLLVETLKPDFLPEYELEEFELANLIRLGLIKSIPQHNVYSNGAEIKNDPSSDYLILDNLEIEIESKEDIYLMTELGDLFLKACNEKK